MTRPRSNPDKLLFGILGKVPDSGAVLSAWTAFFKEHGLDASMDRYPALETAIPERLSEMYHFDRRGYIVSLPLQKAIIPYLDRLDSTADEEGSVDTVLNEGGILIGFFCAGESGMRAGIWGVSSKVENQH